MADTLCKHDWVGDDNCAYCRAEELEGSLQSEVLANRIQAEQIERLEQLNAELLEALKVLVELKDHKEANGKDAYYLTQQPIAWDKARAVIAKVES